MYQVYTNTTGYDVYISPQNGGKVNYQRYSTYPYTQNNIEHCALVDWDKMRIGKGYVKSIGDWDKYSYVERLERG